MVARRHCGCLSVVTGFPDGEVVWNEVGWCCWNRRFFQAGRACNMYGVERFPSIVAMRPSRTSACKSMRRD